MFGVPNPQFLLQPWKNLAQFTEELFAALTSKAPVEHQGPVTIRVPEGQTALRIVRGGTELAPETSRPSRVIQAQPSPTTTRTETFVRGQPDRFQAPSFPDLPSSARQSPGQIVQPPLPAQPPLRQPAPIPWQQPPTPPPLPSIPQSLTSKASSVPLVSIEGPVAFTGPEPVRFESPPQIFDQRRRKYITPKAFELPDMPGTPAFAVNSSGTTVFVGKVQSGTGNSYSVVLYQNGPDGDADPSAVAVTIPMIASTETIAPGTWLYGIFQFTDTNGNDTYSCQPPVWM